MIQIGEQQLTTILANPAAFYEMLTARKGYTPKTPRCEGDNEFLLSDVSAMNCLVSCVVVHKRREAFLLLLSPEDVAEFRDRLSESLLALNSLTFSTAITGRR